MNFVMTALAVESISNLLHYGFRFSDGESDAALHLAGELLDHATPKQLASLEEARGAHESATSYGWCRLVCSMLPADTTDATAAWVARCLWDHNDYQPHSL